MEKENVLRRFLQIGHLEGVSYLLLLFIAMPLKYFFKIEKAVYYTGMAHGVLFITFMLLLAILFFQHKIAFKKCFAAFLLSLIPFGTFFLRKIGF